MALGWRSPQLVMGMLWEGRMWRGWGYWGSLHVLVLLQTDWDSLQNRGCGMGAGTSLDLLCLEGEKTHQKNDERAHNQQTTETKQSHGLKIQAISPCPPPILTLYSVVPRDSRVASKQLTRRAQRHWEKGTSYAKAFRIKAAALKALRNRAPPLHHS